MPGGGHQRIDEHGKESGVEAVHRLDAGQLTVRQALGNLQRQDGDARENVGDEVALDVVGGQPLDDGKDAGQHLVGGHLLRQQALRHAPLRSVGRLHGGAPLLQRLQGDRVSLDDDRFGMVAAVAVSRDIVTTSCLHVDH